MHTQPGQGWTCQTSRGALRIPSEARGPGHPGPHAIPLELLGSDWQTWDPDAILQALRERIEAEVGDDDAYNANRAYIEDGDHWQGGKGWMGPPGVGVTPADGLSKVRDSFIPNDVCSQAVERKIRALHKVPPRVEIVPVKPTARDGQPSQEQARHARELERIVTAWLSRVRAHEKTKDTLRRQTWARRGVLNVRPVPQAFVVSEDEGENFARLDVAPRSLEQALRLVALTTVPTQYGMTLHTRDEQDVAVLAWETETEPEAGGVPDKLWHIEVWTVDDPEAGTVAMRYIVKDQDSEEPEVDTTTFGLRLRGFLPVQEIEGRLLMTESARRQQRRLDFYESILVRLGWTAAFRERTYVNASPEGSWVRAVPSGMIATQTREDPINGGTLYFVPHERTLGAGVTTDLRGIKYTEDQSTGKQAITTPSVVYADPVDPQYAISAVEHAKAGVLEHMNQGHLAKTATSEASGEAYEQARQDYVDDLEGTAASMENALANLVEAAIAFAVMLGAPASDVEGYRVAVQAEVRVGAATPEQKRANAEMHEKGLMTKRAAMLANGTTDPDAMLLDMADDEAAQLAMIQKRAEVLAQLTGSGASLQGAALAVGFTSEEAEAMASRVTQ